MIDPKTPGTHAGDMNPLTGVLRGPMPLTADQRKRARFLRFTAHWDWPDIATDLGRSEQDIRHSLANARTTRSDPSRGTMNVSIAAYDWFKAHQLPGESMWQTVNRIVGV